jgi:hypothetical protein
MPETALDDPKFLGALAELKETAARLGRTPLMAELPTKTAYLLWARGGSWAAALKAAGLKPQGRDARREASREYAIAKASPDLIPEETRRELPPGIIEALAAVCDAARLCGRFPTVRDLPKGFTQKFGAYGLSLRALMADMGLILEKPIKGQTQPTEPAHMTKAENFKAASYGWRKNLNEKRRRQHQDDKGRQD